VTEEHREAERERDESEAEQLDRNTVELLNELRVAGTGIQVMFAFLLVVPFQTGWERVDAFERTVYFGTLLLVALAAFLLMAPPVHHRVLFRRGEKAFLLRVANRLALAGFVCLAVGFVGILVLEADVVVGGFAPVIVGILAGAIVAGLWFVPPLLRAEED
jgi:O-antigen ligase